MVLLIELIRVFSLDIRLFSIVVVGHTLLKILSIS
jgi:hypothetical protein